MAKGKKSKEKKQNKIHDEQCACGGVCMVIEADLSNIPPEVLEAMDFAEDLGDCLDMIEAAHNAQTERLREVVANENAMSADESAREDIFAMMTERELEAYDTLDNFVHSPKIGLPKEADTPDARIENAEWNTDEYRDEIAETLANFESAITYYNYLNQAKISDGEELMSSFEDIQAWIDHIGYLARELEILTRIEELELKMDQASVDLDEAFEERDILTEELEALYVECDDSECECDCADED